MYFFGFNTNHKLHLFPFPMQNIVYTLDCIIYSGISRQHIINMHSYINSACCLAIKSPLGNIFLVILYLLSVVKPPMAIMFWILFNSELTIQTSKMETKMAGGTGCCTICDLFLTGCIVAERWPFLGHANPDTLFPHLCQLLSLLQILELVLEQHENVSVPLVVWDRWAILEFPDRTCDV